MINIFKLINRKRTPKQPSTESKKCKIVLTMCKIKFNTKLSAVQKLNKDDIYHASSFGQKGRMYTSLFVVYLWMSVQSSTNRKTEIFREDIFLLFAFSTINHKILTLGEGACCKKAKAYQDINFWKNYLFCFDFIINKYNKS